jgi:hypothetical protein
MFAGKEVRIFLKGQAQIAFLELKRRTDKESQSILRSIERVKEILVRNPQYGDPVRKELIPDEFLKQGIGNIYRAELSNFWRMIYTLEGNKLEIFLFILKIMDHSDYDKLFGY